MAHYLQEVDRKKPRFIDVPPDRRQADDLRRLILIGSLMAEAIRVSPDYAESLSHDTWKKQLTDAWEKQLNITRPSLTRQQVEKEES